MIYIYNQKKKKKEEEEDEDIFKIKIIWVYNVSRSFMAEMNIYVSELNRTITARETGSNKQSASKSCALSLVRQLFHLGVIEAYSGTLKQRKDDPGLKPYPVEIAPETMQAVDDCINELNLLVANIDRNADLRNCSIPLTVSVYYCFFLKILPHT